MISSKHDTTIPKQKKGRVMVDITTKKRLLYLLIFFINTIYGIDYSIVFIHIGNQLPSYIAYSTQQARLFNPECPIYLLANKTAVKNSPITENLQKNKISIVYCEDLNTSSMHQLFNEKTTLNKQSIDGFWHKTTERFFYLDEFTTQYQLANVFHLEYDNMLYVNLEELLPIFQQQNLSTVFDNDNRCVASFFYINHANAITHLAQFIAENAQNGLSDMAIIAQYRITFGSNFIENLPIVPAKYAHDYILKTQNGNIAKKPEIYSQNIKQFKSIFDAAALGQYLGGIDHRNGISLPGFINESCIFNPSHFIYVWIKDNQNRKTPYMIYKNNIYRINNLHIHSKALELFVS